MAAGDVEVNLTRPKARRCASFDGTDDLVNLGNNVDLLKGISRACSVSFWVNVRKKDIQKTVSSLSFNWQDSGFLLRFYSHIGHGGDNDKFVIYIHETTYVFDYTADYGVWHHIVVTIENDTNKLYVDGTLIDTITSKNINDMDQGGVSTSENKFGRENVHNFYGFLSDYKLYSKVLSQAEVTLLAANRPVLDRLEHQWRLYTDYKDSIGSNDGTNSGSILITADDQVSAAVKADRTTANDKYMICDMNNKIMTAIVEEA